MTARDRPTKKIDKPPPDQATPIAREAPALGRRPGLGTNRTARKTARLIVQMAKKLQLEVTSANVWFSQTARLADPKQSPEANSIGPPTSGPLRPSSASARMKAMSSRMAFWSVIGAAL